MNSENILIDNYLYFIKYLNKDLKLKLIKRIKESLIKNDNKDDSWKELFGAFKSKKTAEQIIQEIRNARVSKRTIEKF